MTPREYFAAHAPAQLPDWYQPPATAPAPPVPEHPNAVPVYEILPKGDDDTISPKRQFGRVHNQVLDDQIDATSVVDGMKAMLAELELPSEQLAAIVVVTEVYRTAAVRYQQQRDALRAYQCQVQALRAARWPWAWADHVLAAAGTVGPVSASARVRRTAVPKKRGPTHGR